MGISTEIYFPLFNKTLIFNRDPNHLFLNKNFLANTQVSNISNIITVDNVNSFLNIALI